MVKEKKQLQDIPKIGGWGGENEVAPTGKSFRFVRACGRAGARAELCYLSVSLWLLLLLLLLRGLRRGDLSYVV